MKMNKYHPIYDDDDFELEDRKEINLFIVGMYLIIVALIMGLALFIYLNI